MWTGLTGLEMNGNEMFEELWTLKTQTLRTAFEGDGLANLARNWGSSEIPVQVGADLEGLPSGKRLHNYRGSPILNGKTHDFYGHFQ